ncbi:MAG: hypothetical protein JW778_04845 [Candidatus Altiarchaeota archaeon]|nr:hypothetical protein [Candidatus Altiarchaeota archaeon]
MRFSDLEKKVIIVVGVILALLMPITVRVFGQVIPTEFILALIVVYLAYIIALLVRSEEKIEEDFEILEKEINGTGVEIITSNELKCIKDRLEENTGDVCFFNIPLGRIRTEEGFDDVLRPALENPHTKNIVFLLNRSVEDIWREYVRPRIDSVKHDKNVAIRWLTEENA